MQLTMYILRNKKKKEQFGINIRGVPGQAQTLAQPQLRGFICAYYPAAPVRIPSTPSMLFSIYIVQIVIGMRKGRK